MKDFKIYPGMCDSHTHLLEMQKKEIDLEILLSDLKKEQMGWLMDAGVDEKNFEKRIAWKERYPKLIFSAGIHPGSCTDSDKPLQEIEKQLQHPVIRAVGEIGLDYYWDTVDKALQQKFFRHQLRLARKYDLPVMIHNRDADGDILSILQEEDIEDGVIHCFSSDSTWARKFLDQGFYISFAGNLTYKKSHAIQEAATMVPEDRLLVETDAPYLTAQKMRGKLNHPGLMGYTVAFLAELRNQDPEEISCITADNFRRLYRV